MPRYRLLIEYHGGPFQGWQKLPDVPTVQGTLEAAAAQLDGAPVEVFGAGRTDSGVHATGQVAHMDLQIDRGRKVADAMNFHLRPHPIAVLKAEEVSEDFHARFNATQRHYRYVIINRRADLALDRGLAWRVPSKLSAEKMHEAAQALVGTHDFTTFRDTDCQALTPVKTLNEIRVWREGERVILPAGRRALSTGRSAPWSAAWSMSAGASNRSAGSPISSPPPTARNVALSPRQTGST